MGKTKEPEKREVTREEFVDNLKAQIKFCQTTIKELNNQIVTFVELYEKTVADQRTYNLKYYFVGNGMIYERSRRKKIGF